MLNQLLLVAGSGSFTAEAYPAVGSQVTVTDAGTYRAFPGICWAPNGNLLVGFCESTLHNSLDGRALVRISTDKGVTFGADITVYDPGYNAGAPSFCVLASGKILASMLVFEDGAYRTVVLSSTDNGETWGNAVEVPTTFPLELNLVPPVQLSTGRIVLPMAGNLAGSLVGARRIICVFSDDEGATWSEQVMIATTPATLYDEGWIIKHPTTDKLICLIRNETDHTIMQTTSTDGGQTWGSLTTAFGAYGRPGGLWASDGTIWCFTRRNNGTATQQWTVYRTSTDDGATWSSETTLDLGARMVYAAAAERRGHIAVAYADEIGNTSTDHAVVYLEYVT